MTIDLPVVYAVQTVSINTNAGYPMMIVQGTHWPASDPIVKQHPDLFSDDPRYGLVFSTEPVIVEQATAAPGEVRRGPGRPRKSVA